MKQCKSFKAVIAMAVAVLMLVSMLPVSAFAAPVNMPTGMTSLKDVETTLAPGITQNEVVILDRNGNRVELFVATADLNVETVGVQSSYVGAQCVNHGMATMTEQMTAHQAKYDARGEQYTAVVGMNGSYYNMTSGQPSGAFYMEGVDGKGSAVDTNPFFAILKDGTPIIGEKGDYQKYKDQIYECVGGNEILVRNGVNTYASTDTAKYPRSAVGITADNKVIFINANSGGAKSFGLTRYELGQLFVELGCVTAVKMDEGGSATYVTKPQGSDKFQVTNTPSDGAERPVSTGIIMYSTAKGDGEFNTAVLTPASDYVTPESVVNVAAVGADAVGNAAEIPEDVSWQLVDGEMGTVENGVFTSNGTLGEAVVQMVYEGKVVGETTINVVTPVIAFANANTVVPYGKTVPLSVKATYNSIPVTLKEGDVIYTLSNAALGTINGSEFTACDASSGMTGGTMTATYKYDAAVSATTSLVFGKGSEIVMNFENMTDDDFIVRSYYVDRNGGSGATGPAGRQEMGDAWIVDETTGKVRNGEKALAMNVDNSWGTAAGGYTLMLHFPPVDVTGATYLGMWMYIPVKEMSKMQVTFYQKSTLTNPSAAAKSTSLFTYQNFKNACVTPVGDGWYYFRVAVSGWTQISSISFSTSDSNNQVWNPYDDLVFYMDDITADFSDAVDDRENPVFSNMYISETADSKVEMNGQTITSNTISVSAPAADSMKLINYTGLNTASAKVYVDGKELTQGVTCSDEGNVLASNVKLSDGTHTFRFEICDNAGNMGALERQVVVNTADGGIYLDAPDVALVPLGSVQYFNLMAKNIENVNKVTATIDLDSISHWELQGMEVPYGFTASYSINEDFNTATITIIRTGEVEVSGEAVLAKMPVRTWEPLGWKTQHFIDLGVVSKNPGQVDSYKMMTPYGMWYSDGTRMYRIEMQIDAGEVTYLDGATETFASDEKHVLTEMNRYRADGHYNADWQWVKEDPTTSVKEHRQDKWSNHIHVTGEAQSKAATCTEAGYTNRVFCVGCSCGSKDNIYNATADVACKGHEGGCGSVVDWGTVIPATGHTYEMIDGVLKCTCGKLFSGEYNGQTYVDGVVIGDGWNADNTKYFVDGVAITGTHVMNNTVFVFAEDGTYDKTASETYLGFVEYEGDLYYAQLGKLVSGWFTDDNGNSYYMMPDTFKAYENGFKTIDGKTYEFENKILIDGHWVRGADTFLYWAGKRVENGWKTIKGNTYYFWYGYASTGVCEIHLTYNSVETDWYLFDDYGVMQCKLDGLYGDYIYEDGQRLKAYQLVEADGDYYFISTDNKIAKNQTAYLYDAFIKGATYPDGTVMTAGYYDFDADGKMIMKNGPMGDYFYKSGVRQSAYKVHEYNGDYYFVSDENRLAKNTTVYLYNVFLNGATYPDGTAMTAGYYDFDADGKMIMKNGPIGDYFYKNGVRQNAYKVYEYNGDYYFVSNENRLAKNKTEYLYNVFLNGATYEDGTAMTAGYYAFDADGKMILNDGPVGEYFYKNGVRQNAYKVHEYNGDYYFVSDENRLAKNKTVYLYNVFLNGATYADGTVMTAGYYTFDADGKMVINDGPVGDYFYKNGVRQPAYKVYEYNGDYYFVSDENKLAKGTKAYLYTVFLNGATYEDGTAMTGGFYEFDEDGKMIVMDGPVGDYFYKNGVRQSAYQLVEYKGDFYFIGDANKLAKNTRVYLYSYYTNGMSMPNGGRFYEGYYTFDADGKIVF